MGFSPFHKDSRSEIDLPLLAQAGLPPLPDCHLDGSGSSSRDTGPNGRRTQFIGRFGSCSPGKHGDQDPSMESLQGAGPRVHTKDPRSMEIRLKMGAAFADYCEGWGIGKVCKGS